jgi:hypothetical protein
MGLARECPFKPRILPYSQPKEAAPASGYDKAVRRLQRAATEARERREVEEAAAKKTAAAATGTTEPKPFTFATEKRAERKVAAESSGPHWSAPRERQCPLPS